MDIDLLVHSTAVVCIPGTGDGIQAIKAGILEIGDIFIVNKCDMPDADQAVQSLEMMLDLRRKPQTGWTPAVIKTNALEMKGVSRAADLFWSHFEFLKTGGWLEKIKQEQELAYFQSCLTDLMMEKFLARLEGSDIFKTLAAEIKARQMNPLNAAQKAAEQLCRF